MKRVVQEWPHWLAGALAKTMGSLIRCQEQTQDTLTALQGRIDAVAGAVLDASASRNRELAAENRDFRKRLWHSGTKILELEQARLTTEERLYFAIAERDRLEAELRQGRLREDALHERVSALREEAARWHMERTAADRERTELRQQADKHRAMFERASKELAQLREEMQQIRQTLREAATVLREDRTAPLMEANAVLERKLWLAESEAAAEREALRAELEAAQGRIAQLESENAGPAAPAPAPKSHEQYRALEQRAQETEVSCVRLSSENTMLAVILKERDDALKRTEERLRRLSAAHDTLQQDTAAARECEDELRRALAAAEQQIEILLAQVRPAQEWTPLPAMEEMESAPRMMPWPGARVWSNPPESEPFGVRLGGSGELEALAG